MLLRFIGHPLLTDFQPSSRLRRDSQAQSACDFAQAKSHAGSGTFHMSPLEVSQLQFAAAALSAGLGGCTPEYARLTGVLRSKGLSSPSFLPISRTAGSTSWPVRRMQVLESSWLILPSLPYRARIDGRVSSIMMRSFSTTWVGVPAIRVRFCICRSSDALTPRTCV